MVFGLFTGIDNHNSCVTFGACLIGKEDAPSFEWVFRAFLRAMGGKEPSYVITDQDLGMESAFPNVFQVARHRFCMWHITKKMPEKLGKYLHSKKQYYILCFSHYVCVLIFINICS